MICKASQRGGGAQLAAHLLNAYDNERVELAELRGSVAKDLAGAFREWFAQSKVTNCEKYLYSLSINPDQRQGRLTNDQYLDLIGRYEKTLGLTRQARAVVFHEKKDKDGIAREHCHVVWSRIDAKAGKAVTISFDRLKRLAVSRTFARELGRTVPKGMEAPPGPERFAAKVKHANLREKQQEERSGISKEQRRAEITEAWQKSHDGPGFAAALQRRGYRLARGGRLSYAVVDAAGEIHPMGTLVAGVRAAEVKGRLAASHPIASLPPAEDVKQEVDAQRAKARQHQRKSVGPPADELRAALNAKQQERRLELAEVRSAIEARQRKERSTEAPRPAQPPEGMVQRLTTHFKAEARAHRAQERRHKAELRDMDRQERNLKTLDAREARSLETKIRRHDLQGIITSLREMVPMLDKLDQRIRTKQAHEQHKPEQPAVRSAFVQANSQDTSAADEARRVAEELAEQKRIRQQQHKTTKPRPDF